jgi:Putative peptidoglycan binding domain
MNAKALFLLSCFAAVTLAVSRASAAPRTAAPARTAPTVTHTGPMTTATPFHHRRDRVVFVDTFGYPFYPYWYPYWYDYYPYGYFYYNPPAYGDAYGAGSIVVEVQRRLARAGYYHGAVDGVTGPRTRAAIRAYERTQSMRVDGAISQQLLATMGLRY